MGRLWSVLLLSVLATIAHSQTPMPITGTGDCPPLTLEVLGSTTELSTDGVLPSAIGGISDGAQPPNVRIISFNLVCESAGFTKNTISSASFVVEYDCQGTVCMDNVDPSATTRLTEQFNVRCTTNNPVPTTGTIVNNGLRLLAPIANLTTPVDTRCAQCVDTTVSAAVSEVTHCRPCRSQCDVGQRRCIAINPDSCCNFYMDDICVLNCTTPLVGDPETFDCGCEVLSPGNVGTFISAPGRYKVGSIVTYSCDENNGYTLPTSTMDATRTCSLSTGWSGSDIMCGLHDCLVGDITKPESGSVNYDSTLFNSVAVFSCDDGFMLVGSSMRTCGFNGWSGTNPTCERVRIDCGDCNGGTCDFNTGTCTCLPGWTGMDCSASTATTPPVVNPGGQSGSGCAIGCIIGIVVAVLAAIIIAAIVAGVAYGIYSYLNHPDTKLAKLDADNINGVARDNPLYVDPEAVVGTGDGAEAA